MAKKITSGYVKENSYKDEIGCSYCHGITGYEERDLFAVEEKQVFCLGVELSEKRIYLRCASCNSLIQVFTLPRIVEARVIARMPPRRGPSW